MIEFLYEKLSQFIDIIGSKWGKLTDGKRGADDFSGFLWIFGAILIILNVFTKSAGALVFGLFFVVYGLFRCFSPFAYHDVESTAVLKIVLAVKKIFMKIGGFFQSKYEELKATDKSELVNQIKGKKSDDENVSDVVDEKRKEDELDKAINASIAASAKLREESESDKAKKATIDLKELFPEEKKTPETKIETPGVTSSVEAAKKAVDAMAVEMSKTLETQSNVAPDKPMVTPKPIITPKADTPTSPVKTKPTAQTKTTAQAKPTVQTKTTAQTKPSTQTKPVDPTDKSAYYIFECPGCKKKVRIPNRGKKGRVAIVCPSCQTRFVRMRW